MAALWFMVFREIGAELFYLTASLHILRSLWAFGTYNNCAVSLALCENITTVFKGFGAQREGIRGID